MSELSFRSNPLQKDYLGAYHAAKLVWYDLRTDDELYRVADREEYVATQVGAEFPDIPKSDLAWLGNLANQSVLEQLNLT